MENKKTKLTISGSPKKTLKNFDSSKLQEKKTVKIGNHINKSVNKVGFKKPFGFKSQPFKKKGIQSKSNFPSKTSLATSDFEKRKLAE